MYENYLPLLGGLAGRTPVELNGMPHGMRAVTVPVRRKGETRVPRDRKGRTQPTRVDVLAAEPTLLFSPPDSVSKQDLIWVLSRETRRWSTVTGRFGQRTDVVVDQLIRAGGIVLRCEVDQDRIKLGQPEGWRLSHAWREQAPDELAELRPRRDPDEVRAELLSLLDEARDHPAPMTKRRARARERLMIERAVLVRVPPGTGLVVPEGTATTAKSWPTYEAALRAACKWLSFRHVPGAAELAGRAWGDTHVTWSAARMLVFSQLVGQRFELAVDGADVEIRLCGPLLWQHGNAIADAARARPWIGLPRDGMWLVGRVECSADGILVIENAETFKKVSANDKITRSWLCVWGKGKAVVNAAELINRLPGRKVAAWMDLDASGLEIFTMLDKAVEEPVRPVAMTLELLTAGQPRRRAGREEQAKAERYDRELAAKLEPLLSGELAEIARHIKDTGRAVEQQVLHERVLPILPALLDSI
ncbi:DUF2220 domain-containing protein [Lentzea alba]|uniref:Wadjet anti-phage system protein JetD domain-containing protein n=1 Tax=Lentzea alba TaxID=2714351 RepID=UPI0039BF154D